MKTNEKQVVVSVSMITYNHEAFIAQAIEGVLMQQTNFPFELIIGEDCSTDNTRDICIKYRDTYPSVIRLRLPEKNLGVKENAKENDHACSGKYIAYCEGDDYWIDPLKLQKQVDFLEQHPQHDACCHRYLIFDEDTKEWSDDHKGRFFEEHPEGITFNNVFNMRYWLTKTMTMVYRKNAFDVSILERYAEARDFHFCYHLLKEKEAYCMNFIGAVYRMHKGGMNSKTSKRNRMHLEYRTMNELHVLNKEDLHVRNTRRITSSHFLSSILYRFRNKEFSTLLFKDLFMILKEEYKYEGWAGLLILGKTVTGKGWAKLRKRFKQ